ncbi:MAG: ComF family protein [Patescibacteria group bacterium]
MGLTDLIFPKKCFGCGKEGVYLCSACLSELERPIPICPVCQRLCPTGFTHQRCQGEYLLDGLTSIWPYAGSMRKALLAIKYKFAFEVAKELGETSCEFIKKEKFFPSSPVLVPVPLHRLRKNWRGFNQVEEIGRVIAKNMGWCFMPDLLIRTEMGTPQTELKRKERLKRVKGVFAVNPNYRIQKSQYLLFDDVWTTGATLKEAAKTLKLAGARQIWGLTLARGR